MTRSLSSTSSDLVAQEEISFAILLELGFDSGNVNVWSGIGDLSWSGKTWLGMGQMGSLTGVTEATDLSDIVIRATLSHIAISLMPELVSEVTALDPVGRPFVIYLAFFNPDGTIKDVVTLTAGLIDATTLVDGETGAITMDLVSEGGLMGRTRFYRLDDQHQEKLFPGDKGLQFVSGLEGKVAFGSAQVNPIPNGQIVSSRRLY